MIEWINDFFETQNQIVIILGCILFIWILSSIIRNIASIIEFAEKGYLSLIKLCKLIIKIILLPFTLLKNFIVWLFSLKSKHDYKQSILNSPYNVYPESFKIPWYRKIFSHRIRTEAKTRFKCIERCMETQEFINSKMKYITMIETSVGGGKSSLMAGLTHYKTLHFQEMIKDKIENTQKILYMVDWKKVDSLIDEYYHHDTNIYSIRDKILEDSELNELFDGFYNNFRQDTPKIVLLKDYVTAYCASLRNNYVMANYKLFNRITDTFNIDLPSNLLDIKTFEAQQNYYLPAYSIIAEDELSLSKLKNTTSFKEIDSIGRDTAMRLFRQLKDETTFYVGCSQNISRNAKIFRELANTYFEIISMEIIGVQKTFSRIYQSKEQKLINKMSKKKYSDIIPELKKQIYDLYQEQNKIFAAGYLKYTIRIANRAQDLDRYDKTELAIQELYIPMTWAFGTYLKCQFSEFDEYLNNISKKSDQDLKIIDSFFKNSDAILFENILKSNKKEKEEKEEEEKKKEEKEYA